MKLALLLAGLMVATVQAEPILPGYERLQAAGESPLNGRLLYSELGCANCHGGETSLPRRQGPNLIGITQRVQEGWLRQFLLNPSSAHVGTTMPRLLPDETAVDSVVHFLRSLSGPADKAKAVRHVNSARGKSLFHTIGCVACHEPEATARTSEKPSVLSVPLPSIEKKYALMSLIDFIRDPLKHRPDGRMPRTEMEEQDAMDLAGYLLSFEGSDGSVAAGIPKFTPDPSKAEQGRQIVETLRCAACHDLPKANPTALAPLVKLSAGCMSETPASNVPEYELTEAQRKSLKAFLPHRADSVPATSQAALTLHALNCVACHERNGNGGPDAARKPYFLGDHNLGDTGIYPPPLTEVGRKLQPDWLAKVLTGELRVRPYLQTKMPIYGRATDQVGELLMKADARQEPTLPGGDDTAGRKLFGTIGGLGCITCHRWGKQPALGIQALDLSQIGQRLQPGWLHDYLINPAAHRPGTLMPSFWPQGVAANQDILGGDTKRQIASLYSFAKSANGIPDGFSVHGPGEYELIPKDHPMVQRTFLEGVGTHAILIGFPEGFHLAYDGKSARPMLAWKGKFFDAYNTWFSRFAPFEKPLGSDIVRWPAVAKDAPGLRFDGYKFDDKQIPTILISIGKVTIEDRFEGIQEGLKRTLKWDANAMPSLAISHPEGVTVVSDPKNVPGLMNFTYHWK